MRVCIVIGCLIVAGCGMVPTRQAPEYPWNCKRLDVRPAPAVEDVVIEYPCNITAKKKAAANPGKN